MADRSLPPTPRRLRQAVERGDVPLSRVAVGAGALAGLLIALESTGRTLADRFTEGLTTALRGQAPAAGLEHLLGSVTHVVVPAGAAMAGAALGLTWIQTRGAIRVSRPKGSPHAEDPRALRVLSTGSALMLGLALVWIAARNLHGTLLATEAVPTVPVGALARGARAVAEEALLALGAWAALDVLVSRAAWRARLRMTLAERREEARELYGDPAIQRERRRLAREPVRPDP
jgi:flagellar biosynthesis protein FlhB